MITWYGVLLFGHIAGAIVWLGYGFGMLMLAVPAIRANDDAKVVAFARQLHYGGNRIAFPSAILVLGTGIALVIGYREWNELWVILGLVGFAATLLSGVLVLSPRTQRAVQLADGGDMPGAATTTRAVVRIARFDVTVLFVIVADMVLRPSSSESIATPLIFAAVLIAAAVLFLGGFMSKRSGTAA